MPTLTLDVDGSVDIREELDKLPPCTGHTHSFGLWGHRPEDPAHWLVGAPCGCSWFMCNGWVASSKTWPYLNCECGAAHEMRELSYLPLDLLT